MPRSRSRSRKVSKQKHCPAKPPCGDGQVEYKMRKRSRKRCCRKSPQRRVGPSRVGRSPWIKFLKAHGGEGKTRGQLSRLYKKSH